MPLVVPPNVILASDAEVAPVPPFANGRALPLYVKAKVPLVVTGDPLTVNKEGAVKPTLVTVPVPPPPPVYCGMFNVAPTNVAAPLVPVVVKVIAACLSLNILKFAAVNIPFTVVLALLNKFCLPLKVFQSVDVKIPLTLALAFDKAFCLPLNVVQSVDVKNPFTLLLA